MFINQVTLTLSMIDDIIRTLYSKQKELEQEWKLKLAGSDEKNLMLRMNSLGSQISYLEDVKNTGEYEGELVADLGDKQEMKVFYYYPVAKQGLVLQYGKLGLSSISHGHIEREDFLKQYDQTRQEMKTAETVRKVKKYTLLSLPVALVPAIYFGVKKVLEHKKK